LTTFNPFHILFAAGLILDEPLWAEHIVTDDDHHDRDYDQRRDPEEGIELFLHAFPFRTRVCLEGLYER